MIICILLMRKLRVRRDSIKERFWELESWGSTLEATATAETQRPLAYPWHVLTLPISFRSCHWPHCLMATAHRPEARGQVVLCTHFCKKHIRKWWNRVTVLLLALPENWARPLLSLNSFPWDNGCSPKAVSVSCTSEWWPLIFTSFCSVGVPDWRLPSSPTLNSNDPSFYGRVFFPHELATAICYPWSSRRLTLIGRSSEQLS